MNIMTKMLVVSLRNKKTCKFWSHVRYKQGTKRIFLPMKVSLRAREDKLGFFLKKMFNI